MNALLKTISIGVTALIFLILLLGEILMPIVAQELASEFHGIDYLATPYSVLGILTLFCFQAAFVTLCIILIKRSQETFFTQATRRLIITSGTFFSIGLAIPFTTSLHLLIWVNAGGFAVLLGCVCALLGVIGFVCLTVMALQGFDAAYFAYEELGGVI